MVLSKLSLLATLMLLFVSCQDTPKTEGMQTQETPAQKAASLYSMHCAQCHGEDGKLGASGAKDLSQSRLSDAAILQIIKKGKNAMPPMEALLENAENIELVVQHIKGLRK